jgi:hypothetical protein
MDGSLEPPLRITFLGAGQGAGVWLALAVAVSAGRLLESAESVVAAVFASEAAGTQLEEVVFL